MESTFLTHPTQKFIYFLFPWYRKALRDLTLTWPQFWSTSEKEDKSRDEIHNSQTIEIKMKCRARNALSGHSKQHISGLFIGMLTHFIPMSHLSPHRARAICKPEHLCQVKLENFWTCLNYLGQKFGVL